jgi:hypothetical protein
LLSLTLLLLLQKKFLNKFEITFIFSLSSIHFPHTIFNSVFIIVVYLTSLCVSWAFKTLVSLAFYNGPLVPKKAQFTHERVEYNVFLFGEPLKGSKSLKTFKISLTFRFDKLWHLSKSVHIGENSQILTVSNKKNNCVDRVDFS